MPETTDAQTPSTGSPANGLSPPIETPFPSVDRTDDLVRWLRAALLNIDTRRAELADEGDWEALAFGLDGILKLAGDLRILARSIEDDVVRLLPAKRVEVDGLGVLEKKRSNMKRAWRSTDLLDEVLRRAVVDPETGEVIDDEATIRCRMLEVIPEVLPIAPSTAWKMRGLVGLRINPGDWCDETGGRVGLVITGGPK